MSESSATLEVHYARALEAGCAGGVATAQLDAIASEFTKAHRNVKLRVDAGELGFWKLPTQRDDLREIDEYVRHLPPAICDVVVLGIGGSSLGARAAVEAVATSVERRRNVHFPDNSDPQRLFRLLERLEPRTTLAIVISKSGGTVETAAQLLVVEQWLRAALADAAAPHLVAVTDPLRGALREWALARNHRCFPLPASVGGRFSVLAAPGLLPSALAGVSNEALLDGARSMMERCESPELASNPAGILASLAYLHDQKHNRPIHVLMPYADALRAFSHWFVQLWAESLGKRLNRRGERVETGPTPLPAIGATDQHAQVQLFMEGPRDKLFFFVDVEATEEDLSVPQTDADAYAYLGGRTLHEVLRAELRATSLALCEDGRPSITLKLARLNAHALGQLFFLFEAATAFAGEFYDVDAFDQPGVEAGKRYISGLLGRDGYEQDARFLLDAEKRISGKFVLR